MPLNVHKQKSRQYGPEAVGAVADGVAEGEVFPEGEDGEDRDSDGDGPGGGEEDDSDGDGQENESGENASEGHRGSSPFRWSADMWVASTERLEIIQRRYQISVIRDQEDERQGVENVPSSHAGLRASHDPSASSQQTTLALRSG